MQFDRMRRRELIALLGSAIAGPLAARAQQPATPVIGYLDGSGLPHWYEAFKHELNDLGHVQGRTIPGGNITGQSNQAAGLVGKRLQLLAEMMPGVSHFGVVWTPSFTANHADFGEMQEAAATLRLVLNSFEVTRPSDFDAAFREAAARTRGVAVLSGPLIFMHRERVVAAAAQHKVPAIYYDAEYAESGGLLSSGPNLLALHRSAAVFVDKILKGARPADLPVEQPTRFRLVVNLKTAKALGLAIPPTILVRADEVIE